jgi:hypothetical protein
MTDHEGIYKYEINNAGNFIVTPCIMGCLGVKFINTATGLICEVAFK